MYKWGWKICNRWDWAFSAYTPVFIQVAAGPMVHPPRVVAWFSWCARSSYGHGGGSQFLAIPNKAAITLIIGVCVNVGFFLWDKCPVVQSLDYMVIACFVFKNWQTSLVAVPFYISTRNVCDPVSPNPCQRVVLSRLAILVGMLWHLVVVFICIERMANVYLFICLFTLWNTCSCLLPIF